MTFLEELRKRKNYLKKQIKGLEDFKEVLIKAIDSYLSKKYLPLEKALQTYGGIGGLENAYGWNIITKAKYQKLQDLYEEQQSDSTNQFMQDVLKHLKEQIFTYKKELISVENHIAYEETKETY